MNKHVMAMAVAAALSVPAMALADSSTVTLYGTLNVDFENVKAKGGDSSAEVPSRNRVSSNSSNIGIRAIEPLGGGLNAWFQVENSVRPDAGGDGWATRNSAVGLNGGFGSVLLGQWDTPYKTSTARLDPFGNTGIAAYTGILGGNSTPTGANTNRAAFDRRQSNSVQYWTPNLGGFSARLGYGANEEKAGNVNPYLWSAFLAYDNGPIYVGAAYEEHNEYEGDQNEDSGAKIFGGFKFGNTTIGAVWEQIKYESKAATGSFLPFTSSKGVIPAGTSFEAELNSYFVSVSHTLGNHIFRLGYGWDGDFEVNGSEVSEAEAKQWSLGYGYNLSKRTEFYAIATKIDNDRLSANNFSVNSLPGLVAGQDPQGFGVGFRHTF